MQITAFTYGVMIETVVLRDFVENPAKVVVFRVFCVFRGKKLSSFRVSFKSLEVPVKLHRKKNIDSACADCIIKFYVL